MDRYRRFPPVARGVTLIELMIGLVVLALIGALALPSFLGQIRQARRSDAVDAAARVQQAQERWRASNPSYTAALASLGVSATSGGGHYTLSLSAASATGYTLTLTAASGSSQANDSGCTTLSVAVVAGAATQTPAACWRR